MPPLYQPITDRQLDAISPGSGSYLFVGLAGSGKHLAAINIVRRLNCPNGGGDNCSVCVNISRGSFPDLRELASDAMISIEDIQHLQRGLSQRPFSPQTSRIVVIDISNGITREAQSRLLKMLEEPPQQTTIILLAVGTTALLATVTSRCRIIHFNRLSRSQINQYLAKKVTTSQATEVMNLKPASIGEALRLATRPELRQAYVQDMVFVQSFLQASLFTRLAMVQQLKLRSRVGDLIGMMARLSKDVIGDVTPFAAYEEAEAMLAANIGPRTVMEALALAL